MEYQEENTEQVKKMCRKGAIVEIQEQLGRIEVANDHIKDIKEALSEDYGKPEAARIVELAKLMEKNKLTATITKANQLEELKEAIFNG